MLVLKHQSTSTLDSFMLCFAQITSVFHSSFPQTSRTAMDKTFAKSEDFVQREIAGECILIPLQRQLTDVNSLFVLNETGAAIWRRIDGTASLNTIAQDICNEFEVSLEQVQQDLSALIDDLMSIQAIHQVLQK